MKRKKKRKLRIILYGGPWGFLSGKFPMDVYFTDRKKDLSRYARNEGNALSFVLEDTDLSFSFARALDSGQFLKDVQKGSWELRFIPDSKEVS